MMIWRLKKKLTILLISWVSEAIAKGIKVRMGMIILIIKTGSKKKGDASMTEMGCMFVQVIRKLPQLAQSGKILSGPAINKPVNIEEVVNEPAKQHPEECEKLSSSIDLSDKEKEKKVVLKPMPRPPPLFPQWLRKKADDAKFSKFLALEQMPGYAKFMKELVTKKRAVSCELEAGLHHYSAIFIGTLTQKKSDPGAVTIPCTIGTMKFTKALCDLGASVNLMPLTIYKKLGLENPTPTNMRLVMADRSVKQPIGILYDVLFKVSKFIFPADFIILYCEVDFEVPIILG
ncbi:uncharacterized protein LOC107874360 [Capsicum annuum]|uniref:uncharacterized protein LOC107874360 n=1 Tax=Capsicum annuum TaxID=4072 RepID=UPI001FB0AF47|nr:uncharacterized protein LOC107874360 [Capsicum annuum]